MRPGLEQLERRDCPARIALVNLGLPPEQAEELRASLQADFAPLGPMRVTLGKPRGADFIVRLHAGMPPPDDDLPLISRVNGRVINIYAEPHTWIQNPGEPLSELLRVTAARDLAFLMGAEEHWDSDDPSNVLNTGDVWHWGDIAYGATFKGDGAAAVRSFLRSGVS